MGPCSGRGPERGTTQDRLDAVSRDLKKVVVSVSFQALVLRGAFLASSFTMSGSMTNRRVLRSLDHMWQGTNNKFIRKLRPTQAQTTPAYVPPKDRIAFWNIVPGDVVKLRTGAVGHDEQGKQIRGEGIVTSIDRTTNRVWLRDPDVCTLFHSPLGTS